MMNDICLVVYTNRHIWAKTMMDTAENQIAEDRRTRMALLSQASPKVFAKQWQQLGIDPEFEILRGPETGLVSLKGRIGGGGAPFPFGDATATRVSVRLADNRVGHAMMLGRDTNRVTIAAVIDALCQNADDRKKIDSELLAPLEASILERDATRSAQTAATRVDFFTMVRGED